jgi:hypothetical protein
MTTSPPTLKPRRRWLQFSLRTMMALMLAFSVGFGWWHHRQQIAERSLEIERLRREVAQLRVKAILTAGVFEETKSRALLPYIKTGDTWDDVCRRLGPGDAVSAHGPGFGQHEYQGLGLVVATYPDGEVCGFGCYVRAEDKPGTWTLKWLCHDEPTTWPKSVKRRPRSDDMSDAETAYLRCLTARSLCDKQLSP